MNGDSVLTMEQAHVFNLISDYVLGLLPASERLLVEQHAAGCGLCRQQLDSERALSRRLHDTLAALPAPHPLRLAQWQPTPPARRRPAVLHHVWHKGWVTIGLLVMIFAGTLYLRPLGDKHNTLWPAPRPYVIATATEQPTITATATKTANQIDPAETPTVAATPIAALPILTGSE